METINCANCGFEFPEKLLQCPDCGFGKPKKKGKPWMTLIGVLGGSLLLGVIAIIIIILAFLSSLVKSCEDAIQNANL
jgi:hypothetical protein